MDRASTVKSLAWIDQVAGYVWVFLTLLMILAIYLLARSEGQAWQRYSYHVLTLIIVVWLYPLYTLGFWLVSGLIGNIAVGLLAVHVVWVVSASSAAAAAPIAPAIVMVDATSSQLEAVEPEIRSRVRCSESGAMRLLKLRHPGAVT